MCLMYRGYVWLIGAGSGHSIFLIVNNIASWKRRVVPRSKPKCNDCQWYVELEAAWFGPRFFLFFFYRPRVA